MKIPIAISFDNNYKDYAIVMLTSLFENKKEDTIYEIIILKNGELLLDLIDDLFNKYKNVSYKVIDVGNAFAGAFEIRGVTIASYYRLLLPKLLPNYNKVIYLDVDLIVTVDLSVFFKTDITNNYVAGTCAAFKSRKDTSYLQSLDIEPSKYINAGVLLINLELVRKDNIDNQWINESSKNYLFQDQDIINIVCKDRIVIFSETYNLTNNIRINYGAEYLLSGSIIHYSGPKPWAKNCLDSDIWWEYYRKSLAYNFNVYQRRQSEILQLKNISIMDLIKLLAIKYIFKTKIKYFEI